MNTIMICISLYCFHRWSARIGFRVICHFFSSTIQFWSFSILTECNCLFVLQTHLHKCTKTQLNQSEGFQSSALRGPSRTVSSLHSLTATEFGLSCKYMHCSMSIWLLKSFGFACMLFLCFSNKAWFYLHKHISFMMVCWLMLPCVLSLLQPYRLS